MSDDEADPELLALLRESLGLGPKSASAPADTKVLSSAEYIYNNSIDVALDPRNTKQAAKVIYQQMSSKGYSTKTWVQHELHPSISDMTPREIIDFIFTMDVLNFCFWSEKGPEERFAIRYREKRWTGYWSLVAALRRALDQSIPITTPSFWTDEEAFSLEVLRDVFGSETEEEIPLLEERFECLREAGTVLAEEFDGDVTKLVAQANNSAASLVNLLVDYFPGFRDEHRFDGKRVRILKRAQIFVADLWAAFEGKDYGAFDDIEKITMFADYRIPQMLYSLGCLSFSPPLESAIRNLREIEPGHTWELQLRGCSIWSIELIRREILREHPETEINAILLDYFLYDTMKELEKEGDDPIPHHRTRSIWY